MNKWFNKQEQRWQALTIKKQHQYTLCFFIVYLILTVGVIFEVWYNSGHSDPDMVIEPIENTLLKKKESPAALLDSLSIIKKNKTNERN